MVFELTRSYELAVAAMITVVVSNLVCYQLFSRSLFDEVLRRQGVDLSLGRDKAVLQTKPIAQWVSSDCVQVEPSTVLSQLETELLETGKSIAFVVGEHGDFKGEVTLNQLARTQQKQKSSMSEIRCEEIADHAPVTLTVDMSIWAAMDYLQEFKGEAIAAVDARGKFMGAVYESSIMKGYMATLDDIRREEHGV